MRFKVDNNNPPSVSIVEITTEQSDSVRFEPYYSVTRNYGAGIYPIILEFSEYYGDAFVGLSWRRLDGVIRF